MEKGLKIVLVDDNTDYLFTMETFLKRKGYEVYTALDGEKGLELVRTQRPDIVLLDIMMETSRQHSSCRSDDIQTGRFE